MAVVLSETLKYLTLTEVMGSNFNGVGLSLWIFFDLLVLSSSKNIFSKLFHFHHSGSGSGSGFDPFPVLVRHEEYGANEVQLILHNGRVVADILVAFNQTINQTKLSERITACSLTVV